MTQSARRVERPTRSETPMALTLHLHRSSAVRSAPAPSPVLPPRFGVRTATVRMQVVPFWKVLNLAASADASGPGGLHLVGSGETDFVCGRCQRLLASHLDGADLVNRALMCPACHHWNRVPRA
ncbi:hypothetical protein QDR37_02675 [Amnibacterium sp. CER49]|uniref:hypothetical protein n=1 Tax=Amnibacterium sp. CER49 TaxID=3039161 RepID=UPI00244C0706|nr:hypothetical protein [Amnibacterium sp. CER49]MDH2442843.1 hypothetical protein [Amnibacterium sp. CER49]